MKHTEDYRGFAIAVKVDRETGSRMQTELTIEAVSDEAKAIFESGGIVGWQSRTTRDLDPARWGDVVREAAEFTASLARMDVDWFCERYSKKG